MDDYRDELRAKYPGKALAADHGNSRAEAVELHCLQCIGTHAAAASCPALRCFLWPFRPGAGETQRPAGTVPTADEYRAALEDRTTDAQREARATAAERLRR